MLGDRGFAGQPQEAAPLNPSKVDQVFQEVTKEIQKPIQIRDLLIQYIEEHDSICPEQEAGKPCQERANILAFLAHSIGFSSSDMLTFKRLLVNYEVHCTNTDHKHKRSEL